MREFERPSQTLIESSEQIDWDDPALVRERVGLWPEAECYVWMIVISTLPKSHIAKSDILTPWKERRRQRREVLSRKEIDSSVRCGMVHREINPRQTWLNSRDGVAQVNARRYHSEQTMFQMQCEAGTTEVGRHLPAFAGIDWPWSDHYKSVEAIHRLGSRRYAQPGGDGGYTRERRRYENG